MKKIYLLGAVAMLAASASAQTLTFYVAGQKVENGATAYSDKAEVYPLGTIEDVTLDAQLEIEGDQDGAFNITTTCTSGEEIQLCCGGECIFGKTITKKDVAIKAGEKIAGDLHWANGAWEAGKAYPVVTINVSGYYVGNEANKTECTIVLDTTAGVMNVIGGNALSVQNGQVLVNGSADVEVYTIDGRRVANSDLAKGIYVAGGKKVLVK